jgi:niacin transporter
MKTRELTLGAMLSAITLLITFVFAGFLMVSLPPFTATIMSHVPLFLAMLVSPLVAVMVGLVSALGFFIKLGAVVGARALMHAIIGYIGAVLIKKGISFPKVLAIVMPFHAILEALVVVPFFVYSLEKIIIVVAIGTALHHIVDSVIAVFFAKVLKRAFQGDIKKVA